MVQRYDAVIIGGGHNVLVSAPYLPGRMKTLVLERATSSAGRQSRNVFPVSDSRSSRYSCRSSGRRSSRELQLPRHGLDILPLDGTFTHCPPAPPAGGGGDYLWRVNDHGRTIRELRRWSKSDAEAYEDYGICGRMARSSKPILAITAA